MRVVPLLALVLAARASAVTLVVPDFSDSHDFTEGIRARAEMLRALGAYPDIQIAPLSKIRKIARRHHVSPRQLGTARAAKILARIEPIDGVLGGRYEEREEGGVMVVSLYNGAGETLFSNEIPLSGGTLAAGSADQVAAGVAAALGVEAAAPAPPPKPKPPPPPPRPPAPATAPRYPTAPPPVEAGPSPEPLLTIGLYLPLSLRNFNLSGPTGTLDFNTTSPYTGVAGSIAAFPFQTTPALQGLGFLGEGAIGFINSTYSDAMGNSASFGSQAVRLDLDATYRLERFLKLDNAAFDPSVGIELGWALFHFAIDPIQEPLLHLQTLNRSTPKIGLDWLQPLGSSLRLGLGGALYPFAAPGPFEAGEYGAASGFGWGLDLRADGPLTGNLGWSAMLDYVSFADSFQPTPTATLPGSYTSSGESYVDLWLGLTYSF